MDPSEIEALVARLVANPHDEEALAYAHQAGGADPRGYATMLERVGNETADPAYASHWLSEAANVWLTALGDAHRAARTLMDAINKDPTQQVAADRLAQLYRDKGDIKALAALLDRRAKALAPMLGQNPELRGPLSAMHEELGRLWTEPPLSQPRKAIENYKRAAELDPQNALAIFQARELLKAQGAWDEAYPLYEAELSIEGDPSRRLALLRDEATTRRQGGDLAGATRALNRARELDPQDPGIQQELASCVLDRVAAGEAVSASERATACELLVALAEVYDGEHGLAYAAGALDLDAGHDRALQLFTYYARTLSRDAELPTRQLAYITQNPNGAMSVEARRGLAFTYEMNGQLPEAMAVLEPIRSVDAEAAQKLAELAQQGVVPSAMPQMQINVGPGAAGPASETTGDAMMAPKRVSGMPPDRLQGVLDAAQMLAGKGKKPEAYAKYKEVLESDPAHPEALAWVEDYLRSRRDYSSLRDVLLASVRAVSGSHDTLETRKERLREVAGICEGNLRDIDGAVSALKQLLALDRSDHTAHQALTRILEKSQRWDDLANVLEAEANAAAEVETKIGLEKKLAALHEQRRRDFGAAAEAWARIALLAPEDDRALATAAKLFEKGGQLEQAAQVIADGADALEDVVAKGQLLEKLGELREQLGDAAAAGDAYAGAAEAQKSAKLWENAERCYAAAERWDRAAAAATQCGQLAGEGKAEAQCYARAADHYFRAGDEATGIERLEGACDLDPTADDFATALVERYTAIEAWDKVVAFLSKRGERVTDKAKRVALRRQAAALYDTRLEDKEAAREQWLKVLDDGDDREALERLIDYAVEREDHNEATTLLRRLGALAVDKSEKARVALREAELLAEGIGDVDTAIARYEQVLADLDPTCRPALQAIADLQEARDSFAAAADALERELKLVADAGERAQIGNRLARLYERLDDNAKAIRALDVVRKADPDDFDALARLCDLCEKTEQWDRVAELLAQSIEVEGDEEEAAQMTLKLASILADRLSRGDEALATLTELADQGVASLRDAYVELGDRLGWKGLVATKLVEWWLAARSGPERNEALRGAFDRFADVGRHQDATRVGLEIVRARGADRDLAEKLEELAVKTNDHDALFVAQDLLLHDLAGAERATELVRQAEARVAAGATRSDAIAHGEQGLAGVPPVEAEKLLERLAVIADKPGEVVDLYERQVSRCKVPADRMQALARAAQVAGTRGQLDRARVFFELALSGVPSDETLAMLEDAASEGDRVAGGDKQRRALCQALAAGGGGARDGGKTRAALLRRAASIAYHSLKDTDQAFAWLGDSLVAHVDAAALDGLEEMARDVGDMARAEAAVTHALTEVFDGPLVRQLLSRRAKIRRSELGDRTGAAADLKKLHDLSPNEPAVMDELSSLLTELGDYRGMVQLYEDQILRGKDMGTRAELARKVARMWEEQLADPREAADAWRRVLRMKPGDPEATSGLDRAKANMLKKPDPDAPADQYAPPRISSMPPPQSQIPASQTTQPSVGIEPKPRAPVRPPPERLEMPTDTGAIVAALTDTSETPAGQERGAAEQQRGASDQERRDSEFPTMALPADQVAALQQASTFGPTSAGPGSITTSDTLNTVNASDLLSTTDEHAALPPGADPALEFNDETLARPFEMPIPVDIEEEDVVIVDDIAEAVDDEDEEGEPKKSQSSAPPVPRGS
jgi:tetratricopeptide (TPR) repeat protein